MPHVLVGVPVRSRLLANQHQWDSPPTPRLTPVTLHLHYSLPLRCIRPHKINSTAAPASTTHSQTQSTSASKLIPTASCNEMLIPESSNSRHKQLRYAKGPHYNNQKFPSVRTQHYKQASVITHISCSPMHLAVSSVIASLSSSILEPHFSALSCHQLADQLLPPNHQELLPRSPAIAPLLSCKCIRIAPLSLALPGHRVHSL